jgi:preprotein translocase subunit SecG
MLYFSVIMQWNFPSVSVTYLGCDIISIALSCISVVGNIALGAIMIIRLHAMYQRSRAMLTFLVVVFLALTITSVVVVVIQHGRYSWDVFVLSGTYLCVNMGEADSARLEAVTWILGSVWEVLALCLALRVTVKHIRELQRFRATGQTIADCFTVLIQTHVFYFVFFVTGSCFIIGWLSPKISNSTSVGAQVYSGISQISFSMQLFILGPRLILSVREYHAKFVANSEAGTGITTIAFQDSTHVSAGGGV